MTEPMGIESFVLIFIFVENIMYPALYTKIIFKIFYNSLQNRFTFVPHFVKIHFVKMELLYPNGF